MLVDYGWRFRRCSSGFGLLNQQQQRGVTVAARWIRLPTMVMP